MAPIYEYSCHHCGHEFESLSKPYDPVECVNCKAQGAERKFPLISGHTWKCSPDGAGARSDANFRQTQKEAKKERVSSIEKKQLADYE